MQIVRLRRAAVVALLICAIGVDGREVAADADGEPWQRAIAEGDAVFEQQRPPWEAEAAYRRALATVGRDDPVARAIVLDRLGRAEAAQGRYEEAEVTYLTSLRLRLGSATETRLAEDTASTLDHLGNLYFTESREEEGFAVLQQSLQLRERMYGEDSIQTAASWLLLGGAHEGRGALDEAEIELRRAVMILRKRARSAEERHDLGVALLNLATVLERQGRNEEAEPLVEEGVRYSLDPVAPNPDYR